MNWTLEIRRFTFRYHISIEQPMNMLNRINNIQYPISKLLKFLIYYNHYRILEREKKNNNLLHFYLGTHTYPRSIDDHKFSSN